MKTAHYTASLLCVVLTCSGMLNAYYDPSYYGDVSTVADRKALYAAIAEMWRMDRVKQPNVMVPAPKHNRQASSNIWRSQPKHHKNPYSGKNLKQPQRGF